RVKRGWSVSTELIPAAALCPAVTTNQVEPLSSFPTEVSPYESSRWDVVNLDMLLLLVY
ncbi:hypothetical protein NDU88_005913, partial [Pleurodeles waltl]